MAVSEVSLCNRALSAMGSRSTIASLTENSKEAKECKLHYESVRDELLSMAFWNFARKQAPLTQIGSSQNQTSLAPWDFEYAYPADCIQVRFLLPFNTVAPTEGVPIFTVQTPYSGGFNSSQTPVPFLISGDEDGNGNDITVVLANMAQATGVYTKRIVNPELFAGQFQQALVSLLASRIVINLSGDKGLKDRLLKETNTWITNARVSDGNEGLTVQSVTPDWVTIRGYGGLYGGYFVSPLPSLYPVS